MAIWGYNRTPTEKQRKKIYRHNNKRGKSESSISYSHSTHIYIFSRQHMDVDIVVVVYGIMAYIRCGIAVVVLIYICVFLLFFFSSFRGIPYKRVHSVRARGFCLPCRGALVVGVIFCKQHRSS